MTRMRRPRDLPPPGPTPVAGGTAELLADADRDGSWMLLVDDTPQSHVDLEDPTHLEFEYVRRIGHVLDRTRASGKLEDEKSKGEYTRRVSGAVHGVAPPPKTRARATTV